MEDLWKLRDMTYRVGDLADKAEYDRLLKRFREQEERKNRDNLLYGEAEFAKPDREQEKE